METTNTLTIINKSGIDSLVEVRNKVVNDRLSSYKEAISTTLLHFSEHSTKLECILNTFDYLENKKLEKVVNNIIFNTQYRIEKKYSKDKKYKRHINFTKNEYGKFIGVEYTYEKNEADLIRFSFQPQYNQNWMKIYMRNYFDLDLVVTSNKEKTSFVCTNSALTVIYTKYENVIELVRKEFSEMIEILLNELNSINNETVFE